MGKSNNTPPEEKAHLGTSESNKYVRNYMSNVKSDVIEVTQDKLENILLKHRTKSGIRKGWITPLSIFITILLTNLTATFSDKFGIKALTWHAIFLIAAAISLIWLIVSLIRVIIYWKDGSLSHLISIIKNETK